MNNIELSEKMFEWRKKKIELDALEDEIKHAVISNEESFSVDDVVARFNGGKRKFDYEKAGENASENIVERHKKIVVEVDWKSVCSEAGIKDIPFETGNPTVTLSIKEEKNKANQEDILPF